MGNIHDHPWRGVDAEGRAVLRGRAVDKTDGEAEDAVRRGPAFLLVLVNIRCPLDWTEGHKVLFLGICVRVLPEEVGI